MYQITTDLFGSFDGQLSYEEISEYIMSLNLSAKWEWDVNVAEKFGQLRLYATRREDESEWKNRPTQYDNWVMITDDEGYLVIGEEVDQ